MEIRFPSGSLATRGTGGEYGLSLEALALTISASVLPPRTNEGRATRALVPLGKIPFLLSWETYERNSLSCCGVGFLRDEKRGIFEVANYHSDKWRVPLCRQGNPAFGHT